MQTRGACSRRLCFAAGFPAGLVGRCLHVRILTPWNTSAPPSLHNSYSHISPFWVSHRAPVHSVCLSSRSPYIWLLHSTSDFSLWPVRPWEAESPHSDGSASLSQGITPEILEYIYHFISRALRSLRATSNCFLLDCILAWRHLSAQRDIMGSNCLKWAPYLLWGCSGEHFL